VSPAYPTRDHVVPAGWWWSLVRRLEAMEAVTEQATAHAVAHGTSLAQAGKEPAVQAYARRLHRRAHPMRIRLRPVEA
jgi:hypothetical protein